MKVCITGGGSGIGRAIAERLIARGDEVSVVGRRPERLAQVRGAKPFPCDLEDAEGRAGLLASVRDSLGGLDALVYAAGNVFHQRPGEIGEAELRSQLELNLVAPLRLGEEALRLLPEGGSVVYVSSSLAHKPVETSAAYAAAKAGMLAAMKSLALAGAPRGVRFNAVLPGLVDTEMIAGRDREALRELHPLGRIGTPADVAHAVLHLLDSQWSTGTELLIDGGLLLR